MIKSALLRELALELALELVNSDHDRDRGIAVSVPVHSSCSGSHEKA